MTEVEMATKDQDRLEAGLRGAQKYANSKSQSDTSDKELMVYPFNVDESKLDEACKGLRELGGQPLSGRVLRRTKSVGEAGMNENTGARRHYLTFHRADLDRLEEGELINDMLVDFFMSWISRKDDPKTSPVHFFSSHFFTVLDRSGPDGVASWTAKKDVDIFSKSFLFVPVVIDLHWSLCVISNPGAITNEFLEDEDQSDEQLFPCIFFLDSQRAHDKKRISKTLRAWLNFEATRLEKFTKTNPFNKHTMEVLDPSVPSQNNFYDGALFVCRYAYAFYLRRNKPVTYDDGNFPEEVEPYFSKYISNSDDFRFNGEDINQLRREFGILLKRLCELYSEKEVSAEEERDATTSANDDDEDVEIIM